MNILAQVAAEHPALYTYGPMGVVLGWFMWRFERYVDLMRAAAENQNKEIRTLAHRIDGLGKAIWASLIGHDSQMTAKLAREELAKIENRINPTDK